MAAFTVLTAVKPHPGHVFIDVQVGAQTQTLVMVWPDDFVVEREELENAIKTRIVSAIKEANAATVVEAVVAILGRTFKI